MMNNASVLTFPELSLEVMAWAKVNFNGKYNSYLGMIEEVGELARCCLKRHQGIRGYDNDEFYKEHYHDAIGDIGIYAANYAYMEGIMVEWPTIQGEIESTQRDETFAWCCQYLYRLRPGNTIDEKRFNLYNFFINVNLLARMEGTTLAEATNRTWRQVKQRNWVMNKENGQN
jgi:NTP pyrophosphatase (non-canonical NTP hydrolase)